MERAKAAMDLEGSFERYKRTLPGKPSLKPQPLIIVLLPQSAAEIRKDVKQWSDMISGVPTQCIRQGKVASANDQYCNNVALK